MKKMKGFAAVMAAAMICSGAAAAEGNQNKVEVNGRTLENAKLIMQDDKVMIPLRAVCEALDFEVKWDGEAEKIELVNLPLYITCTPYTDGYTFAKTAPMKLGTAPIMVNDTTYVPANFISEILEGSYDVNSDGININWGNDEEENKNADAAVSVYIKEKTDEGLLVEDFNMVEIRITVTNETVIKDETGKTLTVDELDESKQLKIKLSDAMTLSLPPMSRALEIVQTDELAKTVVEGKITELIEDNGKLVQVVLDDNRVALNLGDDVKINDLRPDADKSSATKLEEGMYVKAQTTGISTRSIPPQYPTLAVNILLNNKVAF